MNENEYMLSKMIAELVKKSIDNNSSFDEWEKWWRKTGVEATMEVAKHFYDQKEN